MWKEEPVTFLCAGCHPSKATGVLLLEPTTLAAAASITGCLYPQALVPHMTPPLAVGDQPSGSW